MQLSEIITNNETQTRRNVISFARNTNYKVSEMYKVAKSEWFKLMSEIHANGKEGDYDKAKQLKIIEETLETWI